MNTIKMKRTKILDMIEKYNIPIRYEYYEPNDMLDLTVDDEYLDDRKDCSTRSMCCLTGEPYEVIQNKQFEYAKKFKTNFSSTLIMEMILAEYGYHVVNINGWQSLLLTVAMLDEDEYICVSNEHAVCVKNHTIYDNSKSFKKNAFVAESMLLMKVRKLFIKNKPGEEYPKHIIEIKPETDEEDEDNGEED